MSLCVSVSVFNRVCVCPCVFVREFVCVCVFTGSCVFYGCVCLCV